MRSALAALAAGVFPAGAAGDAGAVAAGFAGGLAGGADGGVWADAEKASAAATMESVVVAADRMGTGGVLE